MSEPIDRAIRAAASIEGTCASLREHLREHREDVDDAYRRGVEDTRAEVLAFLADDMGRENADSLRAKWRMPRGERLPDTGYTGWCVRELTGRFWHRATNRYGTEMACGVTIPGTPRIVRQPMTGELMCGACAAAPHV